MNPHALAIGDIDNDGDNEFVIGNLDGDLAIFKGSCTNEQPTFLYKDLGTITCVAVGDVRNYGKNSVICISAEGSAHIFDFPLPLADPAVAVAPPLTPAAMVVQEQTQRKLRRASSDASTTYTFLSNRINGKEREREKSIASSMGRTTWDKPTLTLKVPMNVNKILIADIDGDGLNEIVLARTDRILHIYQLASAALFSSPLSSIPTTAVPTPAQSTKSTVMTQSESLASTTPSRSTSSRSVAPKLPRSLAASEMREPRASSPTPPVTGFPHEILRPRRSQSSLNPGPFERPLPRHSLVDKGTSIFTGQITSLAVTRHPERPYEPLLLVAQPGNDFIIIDKDGNWLNKDLTMHASTSLGRYEMGYRRYGELAPTEESSWQVATELATGQRRGANEGKPDVIGIMSMDGMFAAYDLATLSLSHHELYVTHKLFNLTTINLSLPVASRPPTAHKDTSPLPAAFGRVLSDLREESQAERSFSQNDPDSPSMMIREEEEPTPAEKCQDDDSGFEDDMFVTCAWNGTTYLVDWDAVRWEREQAQVGRGRYAKRGTARTSAAPEEQTRSRKEQTKSPEDAERHLRMVKFEFEGRVCAFGAGHYAVNPGQNVPCFFYVDFEDQIFVYWDIRLSVRPVLGFLDMVGEDVFDEVVRAEKALAEDLTDVHGDEIQQDLPDFVHRCMYDFDGLKEQIEEVAAKAGHIKTPSTKSTESVDTSAVPDADSESLEAVETGGTETTDAETGATEPAEGSATKDETGEGPGVPTKGASIDSKKGKKKKKRKH